MSCKFHNVRFYNVEPKAIHCMVLDRDSKRLAVSRNESSIEIWDVKDTPYLSRVIPGTPSSSVEAMCWVGERLLSAGLSGAVVEWDLQTLAPKQSVYVTGQAAWCIDVTRAATRIAVGTEQGYLNIYSVADGAIIYERIFDKQEGRILCCKFDPSGEILVTGSIQTIRVWNVSSGQALHRMSTGRSERNKETIVWCLAVTSDLTVVSGDSRGRLTFWDARLGEQLESLSTHKADVLSVCLTEDEKSLYCAGVDPIIVNYMKVRMKHKGDNKSIESWVKNIQRNIHQHDVRALETMGNKLFSGGVDGYLAMSSFPPKILVKYPPLLPSSAVTFCQEHRLVSLRYPHRLEIWQLGSALSDERGQHTSYSLEEDQVVPSLPIEEREQETYLKHTEGRGAQVRRLRLGSGSRLLLRVAPSSDGPLVCSAVAADARYIAYSTEWHLRIFKFTMDDETPTLSRLVPLPLGSKPCYLMSFSPDSSSLIMASANGQIHMIHIQSDGAVTMGPTVNTEDVLKDRTIIHLHISTANSDGSYYIVGADAASNIGVWHMEGTGEGAQPPKLLARLPHYSSTPSALTVDHHHQTLLVVYTDHKVIEYSLIKLRFTKFSKMLGSENGLGARWNTRLFPITNISVHPSNQQLLMLHDDCGVYIINRSEGNQKKDLDETEKKKSKNDNPNKDSKLCFTIKKHKHLAAAGWLSDDEAVGVIVEADSLLEKLPAPLVRKQFGAM